MATKKVKKEKVEQSEEDKELSLEDQITKESGGQIIRFSNDENSTVKEWIKTGVYSIDKMLSGGKGVPVGRVLTILGKKSSGKSTIVAKIIAAVQKAGGLAILFDSEMAF